MKTLWIDNKITYDGSQLKRMFAYENFSLIGDSIVAFIGPCNITNGNMKDGEDLFAGEKIYSDSMLHFIIEAHAMKLESMIACQRLFSAIAKDHLEALTKKPLLRIGDDIYFEDKKLNISIATANSLSAMVHCGFNINSDNTPVNTYSLEELKVDARSFALKLMNMWQKEWEEMLAAKAKVFVL